MLFHYSKAHDRVRRVTAAECDRDWRHTDVNDDEFIVRARSPEQALSIAQRWCVLRADEDKDDMGDLSIIEIASRRQDCRSFTAITEL
jgi:hypothetical protein